MSGATWESVGVTEIDSMVALVTVSLAEAAIEFNVAVISVVPACMPLATREVEGIVATLVSDELHATLELILRVLPSLKVPIAVKG